MGATALSLALGLPLAWVLARTTLPGRQAARTPRDPADGDAAGGGRRRLLGAFGRSGLVGRPLFAAFGVQFTYRTAGVVPAEAFVAMPFLVLTVEAAPGDGRPLRGGRRQPRRRTVDHLPRVTLPIIAPSVVAGTALTWARALGEFGATLTFAGNIQGRTQTMPLAIELALQDDASVAVALSLALLAVSVVVLVALRGRWLGTLRMARP